MRIGAHALRNGLFVAPMAGITDRPFRRLARRFGAALAVSEMVSARPELRASVALSALASPCPREFRAVVPAPLGRAKTGGEALSLVVHITSVELVM